MKIYQFIVLMFLFVSFGESHAQTFNDSTFLGIKLRNIGPALMSGRIADIAIHPENENIMYVAVGSGGVWKTMNAGTTWDPIFDKYSSYSTGCITIDPNNPHIIWLGTGENIGGRHAGYGDGIYRSDDGGMSWTNMGLKNSEHISKIIVHPENSNKIWVAVQGPLWSKGGDRGLYKSVDSGNSWKKVLGDDEWIGVTDLVIDPRNPDWMYAATWQRHRNVAAYMGGGPGSGLHRSTDGGENWEKLSRGLPTSNMGKIGLTISPQKPDILYAAIELDRRKGGVFKSTNRGSTWEKQSNAVSGATGPHYYQELYASPHHFDRIYLVDVVMQISDDGGKTFKRMNWKNKHSDNHAIAFRKDDPDYLMVGTDGGLYETFDLTKNWRFTSNLPVTQFYKVAVDDAEPFYNIYGGTQDNNTQGGPSRTDNGHGIRNADWKIVLDWDGHQPATEPGNPNIVYAERQEGNLARIDMITGETMDIKPQPDEGEGPERYNWDSPILISPHSPTRVYFASQRVWKSDNRGDEWEAISPDLTRNQERLALPIMDRVQSWDNAWDVNAMSNYNTITSLAESPIKEGLIYAGTDDGFIQVTEDGGANWRKIEVKTMPGVPATAFVNDIKADLYDAQTVYVVLDNHKYGDFTPYLIKSTDAGHSWSSMRSNLPDKTLVWRIVQDHVKKDLFFLGTEFGVYTSVDGGKSWFKLQGGVPTISFRDLAIQRRENDLVGATFGRGFYVLDDYSLLREVSEEQLKQEASLFSCRDAWWYFERSILGFDGEHYLGAGYYVADNPPFGAVFSYYLSDDLKTKKEIRQKAEKKLAKTQQDIPFKGWDSYEEERRQSLPQIFLTVKDSDGNVVRRVTGPTKKGFHRVAWDLRYPPPDVEQVLERPKPLWGGEPKGHMVIPGKYTVSLSKVVDGQVTELASPIEFNVKALHKSALEGASADELLAFWKKIDQMQKEVSHTNLALGNAIKRAKAIQNSLVRTPDDPGELDAQVENLIQKLLDLQVELIGNGSKLEVGEKSPATVSERMFSAQLATARSTYGPTPSLQKSMGIAQKQYTEIKTKLNDIVDNQMPALEKLLDQKGAPLIERK